MRRKPRLIDTRILAPAQSALALKLLTEMELLKLKAIARLYARGLPPDVSWEDLLQEALTRVLVGSRVRPEEVAMVPFVAGIMRSLRSEHWRRVAPRTARETVPIDEAGDEGRSIELRDPAPTPERSLSARQELAAIQRLFAEDLICMQIIQGLAAGLTAEQIRSAYGISRIDCGTRRAHARTDRVVSSAPP